MYDEILVPTDGSSEVSDAITEGLDLAAFTGGRVHSVYVVDTRDYSTLSDAKWLTIERDRTEQGEDAIASVDKTGERAWRSDNDRTPARHSPRRNPQLRG